jgi:hypothetical protein
MNPAQVIEEPPSRIVIEWCNGRRIITRKRPGEEDDTLGAVEDRGAGLFTAHLYSRETWVGSGTFSSFAFALSAIVDRTPYAREQAYWHQVNERRTAASKEMARDRRRFPHWYNSDGSHIGVNSDGTFRSSYRNTR